MTNTAPEKQTLHYKRWGYFCRQTAHLQLSAHEFCEWQKALFSCAFSSLN